MAAQPATAPPSFPDAESDVLKRFWHPIAFSARVGAQPVAARLLDENLVVYRTSAGLTVARDLCLHRGSRLSLGAVSEDRLVCGFHGFHYDGAGRCTRIPAHPGAAIPPRLRLATFPSRERYGLIWTCLGRDALAPMPEWPEIESGRYDTFPMDPIDWNASAGRHTENFNDVAHLSWVHTGTFGHRETPEIERYAVQHDRDVYGVRPDEISPVRYEETIDLPFASRLLVDYLDGRHLYFFDVAAPLGPQACRIFIILGRNFALDEPRQSFIDYNLAVLKEDKPFVESQCPQDLPLDLREEVHIPADLLSIHYRKKLRALGLGPDYSA